MPLIPYGKPSKQFLMRWQHLLLLKRSENFQFHADAYQLSVLSWEQELFSCCTFLLYLVWGKRQVFKKAFDEVVHV